MTQPAHQGFPPSGPLVLRRAPIKTRTIPLDRVRTVSRRSEPSSRITLMGEQTNPWDLLQPQDVMSRHRKKPYYLRNSLTIPSSIETNRCQRVTEYFRLFHQEEQVDTGLYRNFVQHTRNNKFLYHSK